jgi:hypothetical protein
MYRSTLAFALALSLAALGVTASVAAADSPPQAGELSAKIRGTLLPADLFDDVTRLVSEYRAQQKPEPVKQPEPAFLRPR